MAYQSLAVRRATQIARSAGPRRHGWSRLLAAMLAVIGSLTLMGTIGIALMGFLLVAGLTDTKSEAGGFAALLSLAWASWFAVIGLIASLVLFYLSAHIGLAIEMGEATDSNTAILRRIEALLTPIPVSATTQADEDPVG